MTQEDKRIFKVHKGDEEIEVYIKNPSLEEHEGAESVRLKKWGKCVRDGVILAEQLGDVLKAQGIWTDEKEQKEKELEDELVEAIRTLKRGGMYKSEGKKLALKIRELRFELQKLKMIRSKYIDSTVEGQSQNAAFNYLVSQCTVYNSDRNKKYFASHEDYLNRMNDLDAFLISRHCANVFYSISDEQLWPENDFLKKHGYVDNELRLVNKDGHLVDTEGKLINSSGQYVKIVDDKEVVIDEEGNPIEEISEPRPFLDDPEEVEKPVEA